MRLKCLLLLFIMILFCNHFTGCSSNTSLDYSKSSERVSAPTFTALPQSSCSAPNTAIPLSDHNTPTPTASPTEPPHVTMTPTAIPSTPTPVPLRDNTPFCPTPSAPGTQAEGNDVTYVDITNQSDGYIMAKYTGTCPKVKMILTGPNSYKCTYNLTSSQYQAFPLTAGNGTYTIGIYENVTGNSYVTAYSMSFDVLLTNEFAPYLRPNQYVYYDENTYAVSLASQLCENATSDLDCISTIYDYITSNISYDYDKANAAQSGKLSGYLPQIDDSLSAGKGICLDYAAIMTCMLRSQRIPTRLEVGYASNVYHAWISTYIEDIGWINGVIHFDGTSWSLVDPTFGATVASDTLREFIGDGTNYTVKYIY